MLEDAENCVTVTGTPGVGKAIFYAYLFSSFGRREERFYTFGGVARECVLLRIPRQSESTIDSEIFWS
ncbi:hypothetical protein PHMEG_00034144 [Phytophthora megakarya]|uniref:Uncharacterized protein n=1 Tax=Phytophthora megakarya TaxID=4795 RepID=A0A225UUB4_9STRA|nr:hypothetical protein PHMEG_00034144 [Phytophthora megakarya]